MATDEQALADYLTKKGLVQEQQGEDNRMWWVDPNAGENDPRAKYDQLKRMFDRQTAVDDQGRSVWGSAGPTGDSNEGAFVDINGQKMYRLGDEAGFGLDSTVTYDPQYGRVMPADYYSNYNNYWKGTHTGDDFMTKYGVTLVSMGFGAITGAASAAEGVAGATNPAMNSAWDSAISSFSAPATGSAGYTTAGLSGTLGGTGAASFSSLDAITGLLTGAAEGAAPAAAGETIASQVADQATGNVGDAAQNAVNGVAADPAAGAATDAAANSIDPQKFLNNEWANNDPLGNAVDGAANGTNGGGGYEAPAQGGTAGGSTNGLLSDALQFSKDNPLLTSVGGSLVSGLLRGAMQPAADKARIEAANDAAIKAAAINRSLTTPGNMNFSVTPTGVKLRTPGLLGNALPQVR